MQARKIHDLMGAPPAKQSQYERDWEDLKIRLTFIAKVERKEY
jgi:hypothetical protein